MSRKPKLIVVKDDTDLQSPIRKKPGSLSYCRHHHVEVDSKERRVLCVDCDATVDPYAALEMVAAHIEQYEYALSVLIREQEQRTTSLREVKRLESNAKSRLRTAVAKLPPCECEKPPKPYFSWQKWRFCPDCGGTWSVRLTPPPGTLPGPLRLPAGR